MINLNDTRWYDFSKGAPISETERQLWIDEILQVAQEHYSDEKCKRIFYGSLSSGDSKVIVSIYKRKRKGTFRIQITSINNEGFKEFEDEDFNLFGYDK
jgi:hypothetical protein